ncbi:hypothetical protein JTE90_004545 [Oedothorax gibbosus]|uniref:Uncharacterized protein n=1 Tax=Oedothorax gibbosus TaxID=931172 RepID=A0AAV6VCR6_9ARAC|nr:hypothetical protein JTE90_004545 [Oedothorax gibbosus]
MSGCIKQEHPLEWICKVPAQSMVDTKQTITNKFSFSEFANKVQQGQAERISSLKQTNEFRGYYACLYSMLPGSFMPGTYGNSMQAWVRLLPSIGHCKPCFKDGQKGC